MRHCSTVANATRICFFALIPALKGRAKFIPTLRVEEMNWETRELITKPGLLTLTYYR
jgi:hypothetical protein